MGAKTSTAAANGEGGGAARERTFSVGGGGTSTEMGGSGFSILRGLASAAAGAHSAATHHHHGSERPRSFSSSDGGGGGGGGGGGRDGGGEPTFESLDTDSSSTEDSPQAMNYPSTFYTAHSLPPNIFSWNGIKCPVCSKFVLPDDIECHLVMCLTKPRLTYNEDVLTEDKGECVICLDDMSQGDTIARLPCLCIYHKSCIDKWFDKNRSCPEHPSD